MDKLTPEHIEYIRNQIKSLPETTSEQQIEETAKRLEKITYQPMLMVEPPDFLRITKEKLLNFVDQLVQDQKCENLTEQHLNLLVHHYELLQRLRNDDPEAWDEISEIMEED